MWNCSNTPRKRHAGQCNIMMDLVSTSSNHSSVFVHWSLWFVAETGMITNFRVVLVHGDIVKGAIMIWECCETVHIIPQTSPTLAFVKMAGLSSTSTNHSSSVSGPLRFGLWWNAWQCLSGLSTWWCQRCCGAMGELWNCSHISRKFNTDMVNMVGFAPHLNYDNHPPSVCGSLRFGLCWDAVCCLNSCWYYHHHCAGIEYVL